jgi:acetyl esterase/lipase
MPPEAGLARTRAWARMRAFATDLASSLAYLAVNVPAMFGACRRQADRTFGPHPSHRLDVYAPSRSSGTGRPLIVFWHGGRWSAGDKSEYRFVGAGLAERGYITVVPNYRHYPEVKMPGFMEDAARAVVWAARHAAEYGADPGRLYIMGHSAGAHLAALVALNREYFRRLDGAMIEPGAVGRAGLDPAAVGRAVSEGVAPGGIVPRIAGVIGLSGPYDFLPLREADVQDMFGPPPLYPESQPINYVREDAPPMLLIHGLRDRLVSPDNSRSLARSLEAQGVPVTLKLYDVGHADTVAALSLPARRRAATLEDIAAFVGPARAQAALAAGVGVA